MSKRLYDPTLLLEAFAWVYIASVLQILRYW